MKSPSLPRLAILGAGPIGLEAALYARSLEYPVTVYDAGQAAALLTVQAHADGLHTHQMGGFVADAIRGAFDLPANLRPVTVIAAGVLGDPASAPAALLERENAPRTRRPVAESLLVDA